MTINDRLLSQVLAAATVLAFVLTLVGADVGAPQQGIINALCAVAVLGACTFTAILESLRSR